MLKRRLIFGLLWQNGYFWLSRNFKLQRVGDLRWIKRHYDFQKIAFAIDELVVLNVSRVDKEKERFAQDLSELTRSVFAPIAAGGGVRSLDDARLLLCSGADKIVVNTPIVDQPELLQVLTRQFGSQCVVASIDYKRGQGQDGEQVFVENGSRATGLQVEEVVARAQANGAGEIYLTSIDRDGTGQGYDVPVLDRVIGRCRVPVIASGGAGNFDHLADWMGRDRGLAAATAHLFNFLGNGLAEARAHASARGVPLAQWAAPRERA